MIRIDCVVCSTGWYRGCILRRVKDWDKRCARNARLVVGVVKNVTGSHVLHILIVMPRQQGTREFRVTGNSKELVPHADDSSNVSE